MAEPAPAARGAPAPRLTGDAPQAGWKEPTSRPGRSRRGPLEGASARVPGPGPARPARRLRAPWGGHRQDAGGTRRAGATARGANLDPNLPQQRLGFPTLASGTGTAPQPEVCPGSRAARSWSAPGTGRQCPPQWRWWWWRWPLACELGPGRSWSCQRSGPLDLQRARDTQASVPGKRDALLPLHCVVSPPVGPGARKAAVAWNQGLGKTSDFCSWCKSRVNQTVS